MTTTRCPCRCPLVIGGLGRQSEFAAGRGTRLRMHLDPARIIVGQHRLLIDLSLVVASAYTGVIWLLYMVARDVAIVVVELHTVWLGNVAFGRRHNGGW